MALMLHKGLLENKDMDQNSVLPKRLSFLSDDEESSDSGYNTSPETSPIKPSFTISPRIKSRRLFSSTKRKNRDEPQQCEPTSKRRTLSNPQNSIVEAMEKMESHKYLIGDASCEHSLPTVTGKHNDLMSIDRKTLSSVLNTDSSCKYTIIDCRYPYEFQGGHIQGAVNIYTEEGISSFLESRKMKTDCEPTILIFHCEFSSHRGPKMMRFLRSLDRQENSHRYPNLFYPEIYLLDGGYKTFFENDKESCVPQAYLPMLQEEYGEHLRHYRSKCRSWRSGHKSRHYSRLTKSRY